jgi:hypothetical protein
MEGVIKEELEYIGDICFSRIEKRNWIFREEFNLKKNLSIADYLFFNRMDFILFGANGRIFPYSY